MRRNPTQFVDCWLGATLVIGLLLGFSPQACADVIGLEAFSGLETLIDFTGLNVPLTSDPIIVGDITFDSSTSALRIPDSDIFNVWAETPLASGVEYLTNWNQRSTNLDFQFANPVTRVGMWINGGNAPTEWTFSAFSAEGSMVGSHIFEFDILDGYPDPSIFAGVEFDASFTKLTIVETNDNNQYTNVDDIRFAPIPEPSGTVSLAISLIWVAIRWRRR